MRNRGSCSVSQVVVEPMKTGFVVLLLIAQAMGRGASTSLEVYIVPMAVVELKITDTAVCPLTVQSKK